jgi:glucose dehydrogenase
MKGFVSARRRAALVTALAVGGVAAAAVAATTTTAATASSSLVVSTWSQPSGNNYNTRDVDSSINLSNVKTLGIAWTVPINGKLTPSLVPAGTFSYGATTPIFGPDDTVYFQDIADNVYAINGKTGKLLWEYKTSFANEGPNGVTLVNGVIYGSSPSAAFALDASTGELLWKSARLIPTVAEAEKVLKAAHAKSAIPASELSPTGQGINMAPQVVDGKVYISTSGNPLGGTAYALNAKTGAVLWHFTEVPVVSSRTGGANLGSGGAWEPPAISPDDSTVYFGIGNTYPSCVTTVAHPVSYAYSDSTIALNASTGKLKWFYQANPDDCYDWDMEVSPIYVPSGVGGQPTILDGSKSGDIYAMDANTGKLFWKTPVGKHNGHDNDGELKMEHKFHPKYPYTVWPGDLGGIETNMAYDDGVVYAPVVNSPQEVTTGLFGTGTAPKVATFGDVAAVSVATGKILWQTKLPNFALGAVTATNNLVFTTDYDGYVDALNRSTGAIVWRAKLPGGVTNSQLSIDGNLLVTAMTSPNAKGAKPEIVAYRLGAKGTS